MFRRIIDWLRRWWTRFQERFRPKAVTNLRWEIDMKVAVVKLTWKKSVSPDIKAQYISVTLNDGEPEEYFVPAGVESFEIKIDEKTWVYVEHVSYDGSWDSVPAKLTFYVPDLEFPEPVTGLGWEIVRVEDKPEY